MSVAGLLYPEPNLLAELRRLRTQYRAGHSAVVNPRVGGSHGDMAQALAVAVWRYGPMSVATPNTTPDGRGVLAPGLREALGGSRRSPFRPGMSL